MWIIVHKPNQCVRCYYHFIDESLVVKRERHVPWSKYQDMYLATSFSPYSNIKFIT
jgi:hypothetical protein